MYFKKRPTQLVTYSIGSHEIHIDYWMVHRWDLLVISIKVTQYDSIPRHSNGPPVIAKDANNQPKKIKHGKLNMHKNKLTACQLGGES